MATAKKILVVDDEEQVLNLVATLLEAKDHEVITAADRNRRVPAGDSPSGEDPTGEDPPGADSGEQSPAEEDAVTEPGPDAAEAGTGRAGNKQ